MPEYIQCKGGSKNIHIYDVFAHFLSMNNLSQQNTVVNQNLRILDLILSSDEIIVHTTNNEFPLVDCDPHHSSLDLEVLCETTQNSYFVENTDSSRFNFRKADITGLYTSLSTTDWSRILICNQVEQACKHFYNILYDNFIKHVPLYKSVVLKCIIIHLGLLNL